MTRQEIYNKINSFRNLKYDWDSYKGEPIPEACIDLSLNILKFLENENLPDEVSPMSGEIFMAWGNEETTIIINKDGFEFGATGSEAAHAASLIIRATYD